MAVTATRRAVAIRTRPARFTYAHLVRLREKLDDRNRYELIDGELEVTPAPRLEHQWAGGQLYRVLASHVWEHGLGMVFFAPLDVMVTGFDVVQPDLLYPTAEQVERAAERGVDEAPTLAVELLAPSTGYRDRGRKMRLYEREGVPHYWLVHPIRRTLQAYELRDVTRNTACVTRYQLAATASGDDQFRPALFPGLVIRLAEIWAPRPGRRRR